LDEAVRGIGTWEQGASVVEAIGRRKAGVAAIEGRRPPSGGRRERRRANEVGEASGGQGRGGYGWGLGRGQMSGGQKQTGSWIKFP